MLRNYLLIAGRTLWRRRGTTAINLLGLSVSLAVCFLAAVFMHEQWSMDRFHPDADWIHYLASSTPRFEQLNGTTPAPLAPALRASYPGAEAATRLAYTQEAFVVHEGQASTRRSSTPTRHSSTSLAASSCRPGTGRRPSAGDAPPSSQPRPLAASSAAPMSSARHSSMRERIRTR